MKNTLFLIGFLSFLFISCNNSNTRVSYAIKNNDVKTDSIHPGKKLMEVYCYACHDAITTEENRLAPPMIAIKRRYIFKDTSKEEFIADMQNWVKNPTEKNAKMFGAVRRFGVMQKLPYPEETIEQIAEYMYDYEIEQPEWFEEHFKQMGGNRFKNN